VACAVLAMLLTGCGMEKGTLDASTANAPRRHKDAGTDAGMDAGERDAGMDAGARDAGTDAGGGEDAALPSDIPSHLSGTGLYREGAGGKLADGVQEYQPLYPQWVDGLTVKRWLLLPEGEPIDSADLDDWAFPVGTRAWQQLSKSGNPVETRYIRRYGPGPDDWLLVAYVWDGDDATATPEGTDTVPDTDACLRCHEGRDSRLLGVSAIQLAHGKSGLRLSTLIADRRLTKPPADEPVLPGTDSERRALGYLHSNCGCCHNPQGSPFNKEGIDMELWQLTDSLGSVAATRTVLTAVDEPSVTRSGRTRIISGNSAQSLLIDLMSRRDKQAMPPVGSKVVDADGVAHLAAWIDALGPVEDAGVW
jgi:hypothetical protein